MRAINKDTSNKSLIIGILLFFVEELFIVGYYWLNGYFGISSLTISKFVGLNLWSSVVFGVVNILISVLLIWHIASGSAVKKILWRLLLLVHVISFAALSIFPHSINGGEVARIHQFFSAVMFVVMLLLGCMALKIVKNKLAIIYCTLFVAYAVFFVVSYVLGLGFLKDNILWFESLYIYLSFIVLLITKE